MSVTNTNSLATVDANQHFSNEQTILNETLKLNENREKNDNNTNTSKPSKIKTIMPAEIKPMSATVTVLNAHTTLPSNDQLSDSEEQENFDRTTRTLGAHKWVFNYQDVSYSITKMKFICF